MSYRTNAHAAAAVRATSAAGIRRADHGRRRVARPPDRVLPWAGGGCGAARSGDRDWTRTVASRTVRPLSSATRSAIRPRTFSPASPSTAGYGSRTSTETSARRPCTTAEPWVTRARRPARSVSAAARSAIRRTARSATTVRPRSAGAGRAGSPAAGV
ncbi:hypothetical protein LMJ38_13815 [Streptomyces sp. R1]|uniref:hypothetical protein n=1 Tax=Streptomyces sp. R1 TaxID=1509279 RepID=UPI001E3B4418|nr:hypothetical protein [Streptomyces sp. R1]MCC8337007.1 hypothetical protein [Streptomyces sp. R1]